MTTTRPKPLQPTERAAAIRLATPREVRAIRTKARRYAAFAGPRLSAEDLLHDALLAAMEGRPAWPNNRSLMDYCDQVMAKRAGFFSSLRTGQG